MRMESLRIFHGLAKHGWDRLMSGGVHCVGGNRVWHAELTKWVLSRGSHTNKLATTKPNIGIGDIMALLYGDFDIICFLCSWVSVSKDIHSQMGGNDVVPFWMFYCH